MEKRLLLAVVISVAIMMVWQAFFMPARPDANTAEESAAATEPAAAPDKDPAEPTLGGTLISDKEKAGNDRGIAAQAIGSDAGGALAAAGEAAAGVPVAAAVVETPFVEEVQPRVTGYYQALFTNRYAAVKQWEFTNPAFVVEDTDPAANLTRRHQVDLVSTRVTAPDMLPLTIDFASAKGFTKPAERWTYKPLADGFSYRYESPEGVGIIKEYHFSPKKPYQFDMVVRIQNRGAQTVVEALSVLLSAWRDPKDIKGGGLSGPQVNTQTPKVYVNGDDQTEDDAETLAAGWRLAGPVKWAGIDEHYFLSAIIPHAGDKGSPEVNILARRGSDNVLTLSVTLPEFRTDPGHETTHSFTVFMGPKQMEILKAVEGGLEESVDFWVLGFLSRPMLSVLKVSNDYLNNWGLAILVLTLLVKILLFPLTHKSYVSMQRMKDLKPKMDALKEKYKDKRDEFNKEVMELYRREKVNPLGGCLPVLLQMPVYIALYRTIWGAVELYNAPFIPGWIDDLSSAEPGFIKILPLVLGAMMWAQQKLTPQAMDNDQAKMMLWMMPIMMVVFMWFLPSGLTLYILMSTVLGLVQQIAYNKLRIGAAKPTAA